MPMGRCVWDWESVSMFDSCRGPAQATGSGRRRRERRTKRRRRAHDVQGLLSKALQTDLRNDTAEVRRNSLFKVANVCRIDCIVRVGGI